MAGRVWLGMMVLALSATACGDSGDDSGSGSNASTAKEYGPQIRQSDAEQICEAACKRSAVCEKIENPLLQACIDNCAPGVVEGSAENQCPYSDADIEACVGGYGSFSCTDLAAGKAPKKCTWGCNLGPGT